MFEGIYRAGAHLRDEALEAAVYSALQIALGDKVALQRSGIDFVLDQGIIDISNLKLTPKGMDMVSEILAENDLKLAVKHAFVERIHIENFFASDLLDGDFDKALKIQVSGLLVVLEQQTDKAAKELARKVAAELAVEERKRAKEAAKKSRKKKGATEEEEEPDKLVTSLLQGFDSIDISRLHFRLQRPYSSEKGSGLSICKSSMASCTHPLTHSPTPTHPLTHLPTHQLHRPSCSNIGAGGYQILGAIGSAKIFPRCGQGEPRYSTRYTIHDKPCTMHDVPCTIHHTPRTILILTPMV
jgi:hypothetical protein